MGLNFATLIFFIKELRFSDLSVLTVSLVGLLLWNKVQGFWLIHSIPQFPPTPEEGYGYPPTGRRNGQTGICITFKYNQYEAIGNIRVCTKRDNNVGEGAILTCWGYSNKCATSFVSPFIDLLIPTFKCWLCHGETWGRLTGP